MAHTHTLLWSSSFQVCGGYLCIFQCIFQCIFFFLLEGRRTSGWSSAPFTFLPIFLLAQILMRADLGDEPEHPLEVVISNPPGQDATRTPQLTGNVGQRSLHSARISEETRTADTATLCQTQKVSRYGVEPTAL